AKAHSSWQGRRAALPANEGERGGPKSSMNSNVDSESRTAQRAVPTMKRVAKWCLNWAKKSFCLAILPRTQFVSISTQVSSKITQFVAQFAPYLGRNVLAYAVLEFSPI